MRVWLLVLVAACGSSTHAGDSIDAPAMHGDGSGGGSDGPGASGTCDGKQTQPLDATWTITVGSMQRTAKVHVPASYDPSKRTPLVFDVHGRTQNASGEMTLTHSIAKSDAVGFIAIYPESATSPTSSRSTSMWDRASTSGLRRTSARRR